MAEKKKKRFISVSSQNFGLGGVEVIVDTETGVHYIVTIGTTVNGITPLLDENGNVFINKQY